VGYFCSLYHALTHSYWEAEDLSFSFNPWFNVSEVISHNMVSYNGFDARV
jgi:hypothetical protein